jgi:hypothetical protein
MYNIKSFVGRTSYTIYVPLTNYTANGENLFQDTASNTLLNPANSSEHVLIRAIEVMTATQLAYDNTGRPVVTQANAANLAITLRVGQDETNYQLPYLDVNTQLNYGLVKEFFPMEVNMSKSSVICLGALPDNTTSAALVFWYETLSTQEWQQWRANMRKNILAQLI